MSGDELLVVDVAAWRTWLLAQHAIAAEALLVLAKKDRPAPTTLTYDQALEEALCFGWIDGRIERRDEVTFRQRFTPRRATSNWSRRNVVIAEQLRAAGRLHAAGERAISEAQADGRWERAYAGPATMEVPEDLLRALVANPRAHDAFDQLRRSDRYHVLYHVTTAKQPATRARRIAGFVAKLASGDALR